MSVASIDGVMSSTWHVVAISGKVKGEAVTTVRPLVSLLQTTAAQASKATEKANKGSDKVVDGSVVHHNPFWLARGPRCKSDPRE
ncbi:uncharacterized protein PgNI_02555 [Pyricularia grisea]|uniref:Uncharacterized protein n=1 Tax=Pyricularia grisea TaxID=148305 RepID=A0A6P8BFN5_PYRGI|nr:uncharacterized protein PgNI_02555 [Pyricularia grisea]TLD15462.1 hypothetical protein PgNI_02555 [Pyricularia grisea]